MEASSNRFVDLKTITLVEKCEKACSSILLFEKRFREIYFTTP
jgi:hypothetical protein